MNTEDYVSFEIAKLLKDKGFDEPCLMCYTYDKKFGNYGHYNSCKNSEVFSLTAPTIQSTRKWLRKKHNIDITVDPHDVCGEWIYQYHLCKDREYLFSRDVDTSYENCANEAIKYCLENLIKSETKDRIEDNKPSVLITNEKTGKNFLARSVKINKDYPNGILSVNHTVIITCDNIEDSIPVIGNIIIPIDGPFSKKDAIGDNEKLHLQFFDCYGTMVYDSFVFNALIKNIDEESKTIVLYCDYTC